MSDDNEQSARRSKWRPRLVALALGVLPFLLIEGGLRLLGWGKAGAGENPFVGFTAVHRLFIDNPIDGRYEISDARLDWFYPDSFSLNKTEDTFRVFVLGGSTVAGRPYTIETSVTTWLREQFSATDSSRKYEVVNCGGVSYASYRLLPVLKEVLGYDPDLIVVYSGHNEFLEDRTYEQLKNLPSAVVRPYETASRLRTFNLLRRLLHWRRTGADDKAKPVLKDEVDALLEHQGGMEHYFRDEEWYAQVTEHYRYNLGIMIRLCDEASVPIYIVDPGFNLRSSPPFKSQHRGGIGREEIAEYHELAGKAREFYVSDSARALGLMDEALRIDDRFAMGHFQKAQMLDGGGSHAGARESYKAAWMNDVCPLRIRQPMRDALREVCKNSGTPVIEFQREMEKLSADGIPGDDWFYDHVHPVIDGHRVLGELITKRAIEDRLVKGAPGWEDRAKDSFSEWAARLGDAYFEEGRERLEHLRNWAAGRSAFEPAVPPTRRFEPRP